MSSSNVEMRNNDITCCFVFILEAGGRASGTLAAQLTPIWNWYGCNGARTEDMYRHADIGRCRATAFAIAGWRGNLIACWARQDMTRCEHSVFDE